MILDKWDLKPGNDSIKFMESMVTDPSVTKVIMICDRVYVEKADARTGGVGTESQIISPEIYGSSSQDKFSAVITEADDDGKAYIPTYYKGRIYFDFRSADTFEDSYEQLLRWLIDRPQHVKPKLGSIPESLLSSAPAATATQSKAKRAGDAVRQGASAAAAYVREYGDSLLPELKALAPVLDGGENGDDRILEAIDAMRPYARQFIEVAHVATRYSQDERVWESILRLLESVGILMWRDSSMTSWNSNQFDAYRIIAHELFISVIAVALDEERFDLASIALSRPWLMRDPADGANNPSTSDFTDFNQHVESLDIRKRRLKLNRISLRADIIQEAHQAGAFPSFESILQAEFVVFVRSLAQANEMRWYPFLLVYATGRFQPFTVFARAESKQYFNRLAPVLGVSTVADLQRHLADYDASMRGSQMYNHRGLPTKYLANAEFLGSRP